MSPDFAILIICSAAITLLGVVIFTRNARQPNNRRFALLSLSLVLWTVCNYLSDNAENHTLLYTRLTFFGGLAAIYSLVNFMAHFPNEYILNKNRFIRLHTLLSLILPPITFTSFFISYVVVNPGGGGSINTGLAYYLFLIYVLYSLVLLIVIILMQNKHAETAIQKQQVSIVSWGVILYAVLAASSNVVLPLLINDWVSSRYGPTFTLFLVGLVAYTVVRHRLFDVRLVIARSLAYIVLIGGSLGAYVLIVVVFSQRINYSPNQQFIKEAIPFLAALLVAITFRPVKKIMDRITNKFFYQDAYDTQTLLDELNTILVSTVDFQRLLENSATVITSNIKPDFVIFDIASRGHQYGSGNMPRVQIDSRNLDDHFRKSKGKMVVTDDLEAKDQRLKDIMSQAQIATAVRLLTVTEGKKHLIGYMYMGNKKSGWPYSRQDIRIIETISNELVIAIQNALRFEEIKEFNVTLQGKVDDATHKLRLTNEKLRQLDQTKDDFISMASHQLRTPLTSVKGYVSMVLDEDAGKVNAQQRKLLDQAFISSQRMVYLIADLLNVS
ncbi:MAG: histidine kinase dimerization/phospho-acceptor domain-containing protein, partial [Candidatus Saccharibacteria bacterium]